MKRLLCLTLACLALLGCAGCAAQTRTASRITDLEAMPIQNLLDAVFACDAAAYRTAFPPDYDAEIARLTAGVEQKDFNTYLGGLLAFSLEARAVNYGNSPGAEYIIAGKTTIDPASRSEDFVNYLDANCLYDVALDAIDKVIEVTGTLTVWGDEKSESSKASYLLFRQDGVWYLHPKYYYLMFD